MDFIPFQSSPALSDRCNDGGSGADCRSLRVSILTGPFGPVQHLAHHATPPDSAFQSSPALSGRCNLRAERRGAVVDAVSILTGPFGPVQPSTYTQSNCNAMFQSSPALSGRCNGGGSIPSWPANRSFNPHRPFRAGATEGTEISHHLLACFNPHRPFRAGATRSGRTSEATLSKFQSSPALSGRCNPPMSRWRWPAS